MNVDVSVLIGKTLSSIVHDDDEMFFTTSDGESYRMFHYQDCCESVSIEDITGDLSDLLHSPITMAEEINNVDEPALDEWEESYTWTFYKFATTKGYVTIRWYGASNGYYSESVDFEKLD